MVPSAGEPAGTPRAGQGAYLGSAGGPEGLDEPVHPLQDGHRTQGSQSGEHDEGQHLTRGRKTVLGEIAQDRKEQALGESRGLDPTLKVAAGLPVALISAGTHQILAG